MSRSNALRCIWVGASLGLLIALVFALRDREGAGERPVAPLWVDDDGSSDRPLRINPSDPWLPDAALQAPLPEPHVTEVFDAWAAIETVQPVLIDVLEEPEPAPISAMPASSSAIGDAATAAAFLLLAVARVRRAGRRSSPAQSAGATWRAAWATCGPGGTGPAPERCRTAATKASAQSEHTATSVRWMTGDSQPLPECVSRSR